MRDAATGKSRGFAFLTFADANVVDEVASRHHQLDGKNVGKRGFFFFFLEYYFSAKAVTFVQLHLADDMYDDLQKLCVLD
jgi:hypothetical protein